MAKKSKKEVKTSSFKLYNSDGDYSITAIIPKENGRPDIIFVGSSIYAFDTMRMQYIEASYFRAVLTEFE